MKRVFTIIWISIVFFLACGGEKDTSGEKKNPEDIREVKIEADQHGLAWKEIISDIGRFRIVMPEKPLYEVDTVEVSTGSIEYPSYTTDTLGFYFMVGYSDIPVELAGKAPPPYVLEGSCKGALNEVKGTLIKDTLDRIGDYWYRDYLVQPGDSSRVMRIRSLMSGNRVYMMMVSAPTNDSAGVLGRFVESFRVHYQSGD